MTHKRLDFRKIQENSQIVNTKKMLDKYQVNTILLAILTELIHVYARSIWRFLEGRIKFYIVTKVRTLFFSHRKACI